MRAAVEMRRVGLFDLENRRPAKTLQDQVDRSICALNMVHDVPDADRLAHLWIGRIAIPRCLDGCDGDGSRLSRGAPFDCMLDHLLVARLEEMQRQG